MRRRPQRRVPHEEAWAPCRDVRTMWKLIKTLSVRGAPMIGIAAAYSLADSACKSTTTAASLIDEAKYLVTSRPTAVNLQYCCDRVAAVAAAHAEAHDGHGAACLGRCVAALARRMLDAEERMCDAMAKNGAQLVKEGDGILTHCNTGSMATIGVGTALGVIRVAHAQGKRIHVYVGETRPLLQGGRLTAFELQKERIPYTLLCDSMAAAAMRAGKVQRVFVGADRIANDGAAANKIGTYSLAIVAKHHGVPFHVVAPLSTVDTSCATGDDIPIELRDEAEVRGVAAHFANVKAGDGGGGDAAAAPLCWAPRDAPAWNPAFDVTPISLITSIILDVGVFTEQQIAAAGGLANLLPNKKA